VTLTLCQHAAQVAASDIEGICRARLKCDAGAALDPGNLQAAAAVARGLQRAAEEAAEAGHARCPAYTHPCSDECQLGKTSADTKCCPGQRLPSVVAVQKQSARVCVTLE